MGFPAQPAENTRALVLASKGQLCPPLPPTTTPVDLEPHRGCGIKVPLASLAPTSTWPDPAFTSVKPWTFVCSRTWGLPVLCGCHWLGLLPLLL